MKINLFLSFLIITSIAIAQEKVIEVHPKQRR